MQWPWQKAETELEREVRHHLETLTEEFEKQGLTRGDAMRRAHREFGGRIRDRGNDRNPDAGRRCAMANLADSVAEESGGGAVGIEGPSTRFVPRLFREPVP